VISERVFAQQFTAFWQRTTPSAGQFTRYVNSQKTIFQCPLRARARPERRGFVNEVGFRLFMDAIEKGSVRGDEYRRRAEKRATEVTHFLSGLPGGNGPPVAEWDEQELYEAAMIANRLCLYFGGQPAEGELILQPRFPGCGIIDECNGDVILGRTLYEVKAGARDFRQTDVRQVLIYAALNDASHAYDLSHIGLLNPREGVVFREEIERVAQAVSGGSAASLFTDIVEFLITQGTSP